MAETMLKSSSTLEDPESQDPESQDPPPSSQAEGEEEEKDDFVPPLLGAEDEVPASIRRRLKAKSDLTGMDLVTPTIGPVGQPRRRDRRTVSDLTLLLNISPEQIVRTERRRQASATDKVTKFFQSPLSDGDDLRMAEEITAYGTATERHKLGIVEEEYVKRIEANEGVKPPDDFEFNEKGFTSQEADALLEKYGKNEFPEKKDPAWLIFLRLFWAPMPIMIWIAIVIEAGIQNWLDMGILLGIQFINASISFYETMKAGNAIAALKSSLKPQATCKRDGKWQNISATLIVPGDLVLLGSGSAIPADCRVNGGEIDVDQAALTGESLPVTFYKGDSCKMGSTVVRGEVEATVEFTGGETFFGKTASLLTEQHELSHLQIILMRAMMVLVGLSVTLSLACFAYLLIEDEPLKDALSYTVIVLVASIPLAIEIVTTTTLAIGSKNLTKHGAIVAKLAAIEQMAGMSILCSDKTGTLTLNQMVIQDDTPIFLEGETQESILVYAALAAKWKEPPRDALDRLTLGSVRMDLLEHYEQLDYLPFDPQTKRTEGTIKDTRTGETFKTSKGAPHIILGLLDKDEESIKDQVELHVARLGASGIRSLAVGRTDKGGRWKMAGLLTFLDPPRPDTKQTIIDAKRYGVAVKMITGDHLLIARSTAKELDMGEHIFTTERLPMLDPETKQKPADLGVVYGDLCLAADGFAQVFPEHKYLIVECLRELGYSVGMTGDGVNDAPALKRADIGVAVAGATDAARAAADIVLTEPGLGTIVHGIVIARQIFQRINNFISYRIAATLQLLFFFFISLFAFHPDQYEQPDPDDLAGEPWPKFFQIPVILLMLITLLNDGTLITIAYDHAKASDTPCQWNLPALFVTSSTLGAVSCFSSLLLLHFVLDSWNESGLFQALGLNGVQYGQVITCMYLKISVSDFLTLFSARTGSRFFWKVKPALILFLGGVFALGLSSILAISWPETTIEEVEVEGLKSDMGLFAFVWIYSLLFFLLQDALKVGAYTWLQRINFNNISSTGVVVLPDSAKKLLKDLDMALHEGEHAH